MEQVIAYVRYSSHAQDDGNSVAAQISCITEYASLHNMEIENYYIDTAKSGRNTNRSYYKQMIEDITTGRVKSKTILVRAIDRLHRNAKNTLVDADFFEKHHIRLIGITDGIDTADANYSKFALTIKAAAAEDYSNLLSKNTRAALLESAKDCKHLGGTPPIGYSVTPEGYYEIDETKAPIVRDIYRYYLNGMGYDDILNHLKKQGYKTNNGNDFSKSAIHAILTNPKYMGTTHMIAPCRRIQTVKEIHTQPKSSMLRFPTECLQSFPQRTSTRCRKRRSRTLQSIPTEPERSTTH